MKIPTILPSVLGVSLMLLAVFYAQKESIQSSQHEVNLVKAVKNI